MAESRRYLNQVNGWDQADAAAEANAADLPHLEAPRLKLRGLSGRARSLFVEFGTLTASKQEVSKQLREVLREGNALAAFIRTGAREHYGNRSEKLVEFGMKPFRGRARKPAATPAPEAPNSSGSDPTPDTKK